MSATSPFPYTSTAKPTPESIGKQGLQAYIDEALGTAVLKQSNSRPGLQIIQSGRFAGQTKEQAAATLRSEYVAKPNHERQAYEAKGTGGDLVTTPSAVAPPGGAAPAAGAPAPAPSAVAPPSGSGPGGGLRTGGLSQGSGIDWVKANGPGRFGPGGLRQMERNVAETGDASRESRADERDKNAPAEPVTTSVNGTPAANNPLLGGKPSPVAPPSADPLAPANANPYPGNRTTAPGAAPAAPAKNGFTVGPDFIARKADGSPVISGDQRNWLKGRVDKNASNALQEKSVGSVPIRSGAFQNQSPAFNVGGEGQQGSSSYAPVAPSPVAPPVAPAAVAPPVAPAPAPVVPPSPPLAAAPAPVVPPGPPLAAAPAPVVPPGPALAPAPAPVTPPVAAPAAAPVAPAPTPGSGPGGGLQTGSLSTPPPAAVAPPAAPAAVAPVAPPAPAAPAPAPVAPPVPTPGSGPGGSLRTGTLSTTPPAPSAVAPSTAAGASSAPLTAAMKQKMDDEKLAAKQGEVDKLKNEYDYNQKMIAAHRDKRNKEFDSPLYRGAYGKQAADEWDAANAEPPQMPDPRFTDTNHPDWKKSYQGYSKRK